MTLDANALRIAKERYFKKGEEIWEQLAHRVAHHICDPERAEEKFKGYFEELEVNIEKIIIDRDFLPNSPTLMNAGTNLAQLSACFVVPIQEDSMWGIFKAVSDMAEIQKCGGGTGFDFSILREKNSEVSTTKGKASGVVSFMRVFNGASKAVEQGGVR